jgi:hypothetical protein
MLILARKFASGQEKYCYDHLTRMVWVIAYSSPDSLVISSISLCDKV